MTCRCTVALLACLLSAGSLVHAATPRTNYMERCGGCHGLEGHSASALVPQLKDRAGYFLCTSDGREYVARLPNVVFSQLGNGDLAGLLNYVMFEIGAGSTPRTAEAYTANEVARLRQEPLTTTNLLGYRRRVVAQLIRSCGAPASLATDYSPPRQAQPSASVVH